jgi:hypothetical protein
MMPRTARPTLRSLNGDGVADWLDSHGIEDGVPFLISATSANIDGREQSILAFRSGVLRA